MATQSQRRRISNAENIEAKRRKPAHNCICYPQKEQPRFPFPIMQQIAAGVLCPEHGQRFLLQGSIYTSKWRREKYSASIENFHSAQYVKAWRASFPLDLWPAEEVLVGDKIHLRLKDGTLLPTDPEFQNEQSFSKVESSGIEVMGNPLANKFRWNPATQSQRAALDCGSDLLLIGGAAGSLKTTTLLIDAAQEHDNPRMNAYFFRRSYPEMEDTIAQAPELFAPLGAVYNEGRKLFKFPSGARIHFRYVASDGDLHQNHGKEMSAIAIDESTHFPEKWVRYLLTRNRSVDSNLKIRMRLGTNPGNIGNTWHMKLFFNGVCPHCSPQLAPPQGIPFAGAKWSDGVPLDDRETGTQCSVAYILSSVRDHNLLGNAYINRLRMQNPSVAKALLDGCWNICEGQYFDIFDPTRKYRPMVMPRREVGTEWWWPRWVSCDYGFTISKAVAHLFAHEGASPEFPYGRTFVLAELFEQRKNPKDFAHEILRRWVPLESEYPYRWADWYLSPDAFRETGLPLTIAGQINGVLDERGVRFRQAANDREGGAISLHTALNEGALVICSECPRTIEAIRTRLHDPERENDVLKVKGDELDDAYDSLRYGYYSWETLNPHVPTPPEILRAQQYARQREINPDMAATQAVIDTARSLREEAAAEQLTYYHRRSNWRR